MEQNIPKITVKTLKTLIFVKNPAELEDTKLLLRDEYEVLYENNNAKIEETVKRYISETDLPECHLHRWENGGWIGYHIFVAETEEI
jgi:hypothetical protein